MASTDIQIADLIQLTQSMLDKAEAGIWEDVISLEAGRRIQMDAYFSADKDISDDVAAIRVGIETIQKLDKQLMRLGQEQKKELSKALKGLGQGKKAVQAYSH